MIQFLATSPAFWGFVGTLMYAAPKLLACVYSSRERGGGYAQCLLEAVVALFVGTIFAAVFSPWGLEYLSGLLKRPTEDHDLRAACVVLGLVANVAAPRIVALAESKLPKLSKGSTSG